MLAIAKDEEDVPNFIRMPPDMFDEILGRIRGRLTKKHTSYREPHEPGLKIAVTLRHLASGYKYADISLNGAFHPTQPLSLSVKCAKRSLTSIWMR
jgi:hypothetical protein